MQNYQFEISSDYEISVKERKAEATKKAAAEPAVDPESLATFKINFDEDELAARNALKLPYEKYETNMRIVIPIRIQMAFISLAERVTNRSQPIRKFITTQIRTTILITKILMRICTFENLSRILFEK